MKAVGATTATIAQTSVVATTIAHASATVGQGGLSNLWRFKGHLLPTLRDKGNQWNLITGSSKLARS